MYRTCYRQTIERQIENFTFARIGYEKQSFQLLLSSNMIKAGRSNRNIKLSVYLYMGLDEHHE